MLKQILFTAFFLLSLGLNAQISITQSAMPSGGDTLRYSSVNPLGVNLNISQNGANQTWDYSSLVSNGQDLYRYVAANKTPYFFYFFNQLGLKTADSLGFAQFSFKNIYSFYTKNSTVFKAEGLGYSISGIPLASNYTDDDEVYQFPLNYNDSDVSTFRFVFSIPGQNLFSLVQAGKRINDVDGWGKITTPYKTYNSVLRVKTTVDEVDTLVSQFAKVPFPRKQIIYKWLSPDEKIPVLEITGTEVGNTFTAIQIRFRDAYNGKGNPLSPRVKFSVDKTVGFANADTFSFSDLTTPFATSFQWQITPSAGVKYVKGTSASSRNPRVVFGNKGLYSVTLLASNIAGADDSTATDVISINYGVGLNKNEIPVTIVYPNPAQNFIMIPLSAANAMYEIFDVKGTVVQQGRVLAKGEIGIENLANGSYILKTAGIHEVFTVSGK